METSVRMSDNSNSNSTVVIIIKIKTMVCYLRKDELDGGGVSVTLYEEGGVSSLQRHRKSLEEILYLFSIVFAPSSRALPSHVFQNFDRSQIPSAKSLNHKGLERDSLCPAIVKMDSVFGGFSHFYGGGGVFRSPIHDGILSWRNDADIEGRFLPVNPRRNKNIGRAGLRSGDEARRIKEILA